MTPPPYQEGHLADEADLRGRGWMLGFAGMAIAKWRIHQPGRRRIALALSAVVYGLSWLASHYLSQLQDTRSIFSQVSQWYMAPDQFWGMSSIPPGPLYILSAGAMAVFVMTLLVVMVVD